MPKINIPDYRGGSISHEESIWHIDSNYSIWLIQGWSIPDLILQKLGVTAFSQAYLSNTGHWSLDFDELVVKSLRNRSATLVKGNCLSYFIPEQWAEDNGNPDKNTTYNVFPTDNSWNAEVTELPVLQKIDREKLCYF